MRKQLPRAVVELKPLSIVYLFSGGKDSSLALLLTREAVREYASEANARVYIAYVVIPGNTHPLNAYCASTVMLHHERHYGFKPVWLSSNRVFQEYIPKYGLQTGPQRWCYIQFKWKPIESFLRKLPRPVLTVDGMSPHDSRVRARKITSEVTEAHSSSGFKWWSWHPLYDVELSRDEKLKILGEHEEFKCVVELYRTYGDSLNCVVCPYRANPTLETGSQWVIAEFIEETVRSENIKRKLGSLRHQPLTLFLRL